MQEGSDRAVQEALCSYVLGSLCESRDAAGVTGCSNVGYLCKVLSQVRQDHVLLGSDQVFEHAHLQSPPAPHCCRDQEQRATTQCCVA